MAGEKNAALQRAYFVSSKQLVIWCFEFNFLQKSIYIYIKRDILHTNATDIDMFLYFILNTQHYYQHLQKIVNADKLKK